jgi:hypothetical protein
VSCAVNRIHIVTNTVGWSELVEVVCALVRGSERAGVWAPVAGYIGTCRLSVR